MNNSWKDMGYRQIISGLNYLEKVNPSAESNGKGVLMVIQGAQFMFGIDSVKYLKDNFKATGSNQDVISKLGGLHTNAEWRKRVWKFLEGHDKNFRNVAKKMADKKKRDKNKLKRDVMMDKFFRRYPHMSQLEQQIQGAIVKAGQTFGKQQKDQRSPLNEINVTFSEKKMDVFVAKIEVLQPKSLITRKNNKYRIFNAYVNMKNNGFKFTDNDVIYANYCKKSKSKKNKNHKPFQVSGKFKEIVNLQPFFNQYLMLCKQQYKKFGFK